MEDIQYSIRARQDRKDQEKIMFNAAITGHAGHKNHTINLQNVSIKGRENNSKRNISRSLGQVSGSQWPDNEKMSGD